jgi:DsbC/DsbD-like thiol-disulfide interchange protein/cytochrome c biogenesis protein CcdA
MLLVQLIALSIAMPALAAPTHIKAELIAETSVAPGQIVTLAIRMRPEESWHGYWSNPGDAGLGMVLDWELPTGASVGEPAYPVPETLLIAGLMNHVYEHEYAVLLPFTVPASAQAGTMLPLRVKAQWLACTVKICVPEQGELVTAIKISATGQRDPRFDGWRAALPAPLGSDAQFALNAKMIRLGIPLPAKVRLDAPHLFVINDHVVDYAAPQRFSRKGDLLIIELAHAKYGAIEPEDFSAVLRLNRSGAGVSIAAKPGAVPGGGVPLVEQGRLPLSLPALLLAALIGGLLLNIMPCVFPILSLKALSLVRAGESEAQARAEGIAYSAGVMLACLSLGGLLLALRAAGQEVGWAFQLQEPLVVAGLLLLAVAITANLIGVFEFAVPGFAREGSRKGAFSTGLLAAFVATPCTGPFMAAAMGAALLLPVAQALALFAALGLGLALPFLALAFIPALRRVLPKPGAWMERFRHLMALPMGLTALALLWLASRLGGWGFAGWCGVLALALVAALVKLGRDQKAGKAGGQVMGAQLGILVMLAAIFLPHTIRAPSTEEQGILPTTPFSEAALATARSAGKPVFAYFTADWCLTCKVNESVSIEREATRDAFAKAGVVVLKGDWTRRDPAITRFLDAQGVAGVPLYMWYPAGGGAAQQLPQVLGPETLVELAKGS